jgi:hypothetical protein
MHYFADSLLRQLSAGWVIDLLTNIALVIKLHEK